MKGRSSLFAALLLVGGIVLAGAASGGVKARAAGGSFSMFSFSFTLNHLSNLNGDNFQLTQLLYTPLFKIDPRTGRLDAAMAASWKTSDQRHWTITIKPGWKFQNGEPVRAQSFVDAWNAEAYAPNALSGNFYTSIFAGYAALNPRTGTPTRTTLSGVQARGRYTLKIMTNTPLSTLPYALANATLGPVPKAALSDLKAYDLHPIGNGPYEFASFAPGQSVTVKRFAGYKGSPGRASSITIKVYTSQDAAYADFQAGNLDLVYPIPTSAIAAARGKYPGHFGYSQLPLMRVIGVPSYLKRFEDTRIRRALSLSIDRNTIVSSLLNGAGSAANTLFSPATVFGTVAKACSACTYDPARAKALLSAAGGLAGSITLNFSGDPTIPQAVANMWHSALGVTVELNALTSSALAQQEANGTLNGPFMARYGPIYPHLANVLNILFMPNAIANNTKYLGVSTIRTILRGNNAPAAKGLSAYQQAERQVLNDLPLVPITNERFAIVWSNRLTNVGGGVQGLSDLTQVQVK